MDSWQPTKSHLPTSSYSFDNLLTTKWPSIGVIPDQRCVSFNILNSETEADQPRFIHLLEQSDWLVSGLMDNLEIPPDSVLALGIRSGMQ